MGPFDRGPENSSDPAPDKRRWRWAELGGRHIFPTHAGNLYVVKRGDQFMVRGRYQRSQFAETLGATETEAEPKMWSIIADINAGRFVLPGHRRGRLVAAAAPSRLTLRDLIDAFVDDVARASGAATAKSYLDRLFHVLAFVESANILKRWPYARDVDRDFVVALKEWLFGRLVTKNGRPGAAPKRMSPRSVYLAIETLRNALNWAKRPRVSRLPAGFDNPVTSDVLGDRPRRDPFRECPVTLDDRVRLVEVADAWELCVLATSLVLPPRPGEVAGLLISEVDFQRLRLTFGTRMGGDDRTKAATEFTLPFPPELAPIFRSLQAGRGEGPLLRTRQFARGSAGEFADHASFRAAYDRWLAKLPTEEVRAPGDRKAAVRKFLVLNGGLSPDGLKKALDKLQRRAFGRVKFRLHDLRHAATEGMVRAGVSHLAAKYFSSHAVDDIMNEYVPIDVDREMPLYFGRIRRLLDAVVARCRDLGLTASAEAE